MGHQADDNTDKIINHHKHNISPRKTPNIAKPSHRNTYRGRESVQPGRLTKCCRLTRLRVKGFKSLRDTIIDFPTRLTILVGPNGSGKTALIESLLLLRDVLDFLRGRVANPFLRWWGYSNVVWMHDETRPIEISISLDCSECNTEELRNILPEGLYALLGKERVEYLVSSIEYKVSLSGAGGSFDVIGENLCIYNAGCIELQRRNITIHLEHEAMNSLTKSSLEEVMTRSPFAAFYEKGKSIANKCTKYLEEHRDLISNEITRQLSRFQISLNSSHIRRSLLEFYTSTPAKKPYEIGLPFEAVDLVPDDIVRDTLEALTKSVTLKNIIDQYKSCLVSSIPSSEFVQLLTTGLFEYILRWLMSMALLVFLAATFIVGYFIDRIVVLRLLDYRSLRSPQPLETSERLREDGSNLVSVLFRLGRGRFPDDIGAVLSSVLGAESVSGFFEPTPDGRLVLKLVVDNVELAPPSIPEGAWKTMALMSAILSGASVVAVDEFENSLHASAQELLLEELRQGVPSAIVATHSPVVVDAAKSLDEIALAELEAGETKIHRPRNPRKLAEKLRKLGVTPSEALLYGLLETS